MNSTNIGGSGLQNLAAAEQVLKEARDFQERLKQQVKEKEKALATQRGKVQELTAELRVLQTTAENLPPSQREQKLVEIGQAMMGHISKEEKQ